MGKRRNQVRPSSMSSSAGAGYGSDADGEDGKRPAPISNGRTANHHSIHTGSDRTTSSGRGIANGNVVVSISMGDLEEETGRNGRVVFPAGGQAAKCARSTFLKTFIAFCCLAVSAFLNFFLLTIIHDVVPRGPGQLRLPDLVWMIVPQQRWAWSLGDVLSTVNSVVAFVCIGLHHQRWIVLRRVYLLAAIMYGLRAIILGVTFLPPSFDNVNEICQAQVNRTAMYAGEIATRFLTYVVTLGLTSGQDKILCGDLMFSGHTVVLTLMYFVQLQYTPRGLWWLRYLAAPITFAGIGALVLSGGHYTMDVLIAYWLTSHVFWGYHQIFEMRKSERAGAPLSRLWWFWLCFWFESDVPEGKLQNRFDWPFACPEKMHRIMDKINHKLE